MKKTLLLLLIILPTFLFGQDVIRSINSGASSNNNLIYAVGEIYVITTNPDEINSGLIGVLSRMDFFVTGFNEHLISSDLRCFPNPTKNFVHFMIPDNITFQKIYIYDIKGKLILQTDYKTTSIDLSHFPNGIYTINTDNNQINSFKIIKQ